MAQIPSFQQQQSPRWRFFWRPMLILALGLHGVLLFFPWRSLTQFSKSEGESVKLTRLTALKSPAPNPEKSNAEKESIRARTQSDLVVKASPSPTSSPTPSPSPSPTPSPSPSPSPTTKSVTKPVPSSPPAAVTPKPTASPTPTANPSPKAEPTAQLTKQEQAFVKRLEKLENREVTDEVSSTLFPNPEDFYKDPDQELGKAGIVGIEYVSLQRPEQVYKQLAELYSDYTIVEKAEYGGGPVYEIKKGDFVRHLNLVRAKLGAGTLIVLWNQEPG